MLDLDFIEIPFDYFTLYVYHTVCTKAQQPPRVSENEIITCYKR